jgi:putative hydrolase of the HAD superfamily
MTDAAWKLFDDGSQNLRLGDLGFQVAGSAFPCHLRLRRLQESKIRALNLQQLFTAVHIDAIDEPDRKGKQGLFKDILDNYSLAPAEVLVVGDSPDSEIEAGNRLGITTVQILRPGVPRAQTATFYIQSLTELKEHCTRQP